MRRLAGATALALCALLVFALPAGARTIRTAAIVVHFEGETMPPMTADPLDYAEGTVFGTGPTAFGWSARHYFQTITYGQIDFAGGEKDVYGWYELPPYAGCAYSQWMNEAENAAELDGFSWSNYDYVAFFLEPSITATECAYGVGSGGSSFMKSTEPYVTIHELGHGLTGTPGQPGSPHASGYRCTEGGAPVAFSANCVHEERADPFDPMGVGRRGVPLDMSAWRKLEFGAIPPADSPTIQYSGTYTVAPVEQASGVRLLRVPTSGGKFIDLDFRQPLGFYDGNLSPTEPVTNGVTLRVDPPHFNHEDSHLLDTTPATEDWLDAPLTVGRSFRDPTTGVMIETLSAGAAGATVKISGLPDPPVTARTCKVPRLKGKGLKGRKARLEMKLIFERSGCKRGKVKRVRSKQVQRGEIVAQRPKPGKVVPAGTKVKLFVSSGPGPGPTNGQHALDSK